MNQPRDKGLNGNEKIEQAVAALQQEPTQEQLAHTLTVIRRRIKEHGQLVVAVEPNLGSEQMNSTQFSWLSSRFIEWVMLGWLLPSTRAALVKF